jgi:hypothetical protein
MGLPALTQDERLELCFFSRIYLIHWELPGKTLYVSDRNFKYNYGSVQDYENYLFDLGNLPVELLRISGNRNFKITLRYRNERILDKDCLIELNDDYRFTFSTLKIYELRLVENGETFGSDVKTLMFRGVCGQPYDITRREFKVDVHNVMLAKRDTLPLHVVDTDTFPSADPDDVGKKRNTIYGSVNHVPCRCVEGGAVDNLNEEIDSSETEFDLSDASEFPTSGTFGVDEEEITYTGKSGNTLTGCTRGANGTDAAIHATGSAVWEVPTRFVYEAAKHPVKNIGDVYVEDFRITSVVTAYTGQSGDELAGYEGTAVITAPYRITRQQAVDLLVNDGLTINDAKVVVDTIAVGDYLTISDTFAAVENIQVGESGHDYESETANTIIVWNFDTGTTLAGSPDYPDAAADSNLERYANLPGTSDVIKVERAMYQDFPGTPYQYRLCGKSGTIYSPAEWTFYMNGHGPAQGGINLAFDTDDDFEVKKSGWTSVDTVYNTWAKWNAGYGRVSNSGGVATNNKVGEVWVEIECTPASTSSENSGAYRTGASTAITGSAVKANPAYKTGGATEGGAVTREGAITLTGNSVADVIVGSLLTANVDGFQDDGSGTYTGTPNALIERFDHVIKHILVALLGESASDIGNSFATSGTSYGSTYKAAFILHEVAEQADKLMQRLAFQCRSKFLEWRGKFELVYMGSAPSVAMTFTDDDLLKEPVFGFTDEIDIRNRIYAHYNRDYRQPAGEDAYDGMETDSDSGSITDNSERIERVELTACRSQAMAADWVSWYLTQTKDVWRTIETMVPWVGKLLNAGDTFGLTWDFYNGVTWDLAGMEIDKMRERIRIKGQEWPS